MGIVGWIVLGLLAGLIAKAILPGGQRGGLVVTTLIGIGGALLGGFLAREFGLGNPVDRFFDVSTWIAAVAGAVLILLAWSAIRSRRLV